MEIKSVLLFNNGMFLRMEELVWPIPDSPKERKGFIVGLNPEFHRENLNSYQRNRTTETFLHRTCHPMSKSLSLPLAILNPMSVNVASSPSKLGQSSISCMIANLTGGVKESALAAISTISERQRLARLSLLQLCLSLP